MNIKQKQGFTLIEILIVVAIIAILASVVLVGLGPTQQAGRDARRISDLAEIQNGLELYYNKNGYYPYKGITTWLDFAGALKSGGTGITTVPNDPSTNRNYVYWPTAEGTSYVLGASLENPNNSVFNAYDPPSVPSSTATTASSTGPSNCLSPNYCVTL